MSHLVNQSIKNVTEYEGRTHTHLSFLSRPLASPHLGQQPVSSPADKNSPPYYKGIVISIIPLFIHSFNKHLFMRQVQGHSKRKKGSQIVISGRQINKVIKMRSVEIHIDGTNLGNILPCLTCLLAFDYWHHSHLMLYIFGCVSLHIRK